MTVDFNYWYLYWLFIDGSISFAQDKKAKWSDFILQITMRIPSVYICFSNTVAAGPAQNVNYFSEEIYRLSGFVWARPVRKTSNESLLDIGSHEFRDILNNSDYLVENGFTVAGFYPLAPFSFCPKTRNQEENNNGFGFLLRLVPALILAAAARPGRLPPHITLPPRWPEKIRSRKWLHGRPPPFGSRRFTTGRSCKKVEKV